MLALQLGQHLITMILNERMSRRTGNTDCRRGAGQGIAADALHRQAIPRSKKGTTDLTDSGMHSSRLPAANRRATFVGMYVVTEADAAATREVYERDFWRCSSIRSEPFTGTLWPP